MTRHWALTASVVAGLSVVGCGGAPSATPSTPTPATTSTVAVTTSATSAPLTTSGVGGSTTAPIPGVTTSTSTTLPEIPVMELSGPNAFYSTEETIGVWGFLDRPAWVSINGVAAETSPQGGGRTSFGAAVTLDPGVNLLIITATPRYQGARLTQLVTAIFEPGLERQFAYLVSLDAAGGTANVDPAMWFSGEEAERAADEDGVYCCENGYYIRNAESQTSVLQLAPNSIVLLIDGRVQQAAVDLGTWADLIADPESAEGLVGWEWYGNGRLAYWFLLDDGVVVQVEEQYQP